MGSSMFTVVTNDQLLKRGLGDYCREHYISFSHYRPLQDNGAGPEDSQGYIEAPLVHVKPTVALVDLRLRRGSDNYAGADQVSAIRQRVAPSTPIAAIGRGPLSQLAILRLAEARADFWFDLDIHSSSLDWILDLLTGDQPVPRLPTQWEVREQLGLRWDGLLSPLVHSLRQFPASIWVDRPKLQNLGVSRRRVLELRRAAGLAGFRPPEPTKYSTSFRRAPDYPEWLTVWQAGRDLLGWT